ncbi:MAG TPA: MipA/OmpV family protein [Methylomirabilota bacterium]|nr:MipA/OmpV family protein [Methylomirabilota bacterium]
MNCKATALYVLTAASLGLVSTAQAQEAWPEDVTGSDSGRQYEMDLGGGLMVSPKYPGADSYLVFPFPIAVISRFYVPGLGQVADGTATRRGFSIFPSFDFNGERNASDAAELTGTDTVDWALEFGLGVSYRYDWVRGTFELRQGLNGHTGQVAEFGLEVITEPFDRTRFVFGPRATWASGDYMSTYFGVSEDEASAPGSMLSAYDAGSGFKTVGLAARASYDWTNRTTLHIRGGWDRFIGDASDSPIVTTGSEDQFFVGAGITYRFSFDVFD